MRIASCKKLLWEETLHQERSLEKQKMLDEFTCVTGYHRKDTIRALKSPVQKPFNRKPKGYQAIYRGEVVQALEQIWEIYGQVCSKRLQPFLPEAIKGLERCQEIDLSSTTKAPPGNLDRYRAGTGAHFAEIAQENGAWRIVP